MCRLRGEERGARAQSGLQGGGRGLANPWITRDTKKQGSLAAEALSLSNITGYDLAKESMTRSSNFWMFRVNQRSELPTAGDWSQKREEDTASKRSSTHVIHWTHWSGNGHSSVCAPPSHSKPILNCDSASDRLTSCFWMLHMLSHRFCYDWSIWIHVYQDAESLIDGLCAIVKECEDVEIQTYGTYQGM